MNTRSFVAIIAVVLAGTALGRVAAADEPVAGGAPVAATPAAPAKGGDWIFRAGVYSHDAASGQRVWQYQKQKPIYRDPDAALDTDTSPFPFGPEFGGFMPHHFGPLPYFGSTPYLGAYPYFGGYPPRGPNGPYAPTPFLTPEAGRPAGSMGQEL